MPAKSDVPTIFAPSRRYQRLARATQRGLARSFLGTLIADELAARVAMREQKFANILLLGPMAAFQPRFVAAIAGAAAWVRCAPADCVFPAGRVIVADEDRLPFPAESFDLIISGGNLDTVNDLPGALLLIRRLLTPGGYFMGTMFGAGSLPVLKRSMLAGDAERVSPHIHPQIDIRGAGELMSRAGFSEPVIDTETRIIRYSALATMISDLRDFGATSSLSSLRPVAGKAAYTRITRAWHSAGDIDGKVAESFSFIHLSGKAAWS